MFKVSSRIFFVQRGFFLGFYGGFSRVLKGFIGF